jgi:CBS domain-containing protein
MREVNRHRPVVSLAHNTTLAEALHVLTENKILSAPVIVLADALDVRLPDDDANAEPMETLIGFFDVRDAVTAILRNMNFSKDSSTSSCLWWLRAIELAERRIGNTPLMQCLGYDADLMYTPNASVTSVYDLVTKGFFGKSRDDVVHRVVLFDASGALHRLISQTDVVEWLAEHDDKLSHSLETKSLRELGFGSDERRRQFVTVKATTPTIACFQQMMEKNVSGAAIVEEERVIADITFGDLRLLTPEYFSVLGLPVAEFIALTHNTSYAGFASTNTPETFQKSAFFEKSRTFKSEQTEKMKSTRAIDPRRRDLYGAGDTEPTGVLTVSLESLFRYGWFSKLYKQRVYVVAQNDVAFDVITLTDVLECATYGGAHKGPHRYRR